MKRITIILLLILQYLSSCDAFSLSFETNQKPFVSTETSEFYDKIQYYEVTTLSHKQLHKIDDHENPVYPTNGWVEFSAFGNTYRVWFRKNIELFHENFTTGVQDGKNVISYNHTNCHYIGEVTSDNSSHTMAAFSVCKGRGLQGWVHAFGETVVLRPLKVHTDINYGKKHRLDDEYIVYKYTDVDRSEYDGGCGHDHNVTARLEAKNLDKWNAKYPDGLPWEQTRPSSSSSSSSSHDHSNDDSSDNDIISNPYGSGTDSIRRNLREKLTRGERSNKKRSLASTTTRYVQLLIVNDPARVSKWKSTYGDDWYDELIDSTIDICNTLSTYYLDTDWGSDVGTVQIVLTTVVNWQNWTGLDDYKPDQFLNYDANENEADCPHSSYYDEYCSSCGGDSDYCEVDFADYLSKWQEYRVYDAPAHDNAQLFSYYDFYSSVIGYASLPGMCITWSSGGIEQVTYDNEYNGNIVAHEMGHNFDMQHDSSGNTCDDSDYIMAAVGSPYSYRPDSFSSCSITYMEDFFEDYASTLSCVDDEPYETSYAVCGNGFVEQGESCDCGSSDCAASDPCCDGSICTIFSDKECSNDDDCCEDCLIKSSGSTCRALDSDNSCDIAAELCDGESSECPSDTFYMEGTGCEPSGTNDIEGYCYSGDCISIREQCEVYGPLYGDSGLSYSYCESTWSTWKTTDSCGDIKCESSGSTTCSVVDSNIEYDVGTPCDTSTGACSTGVCQCSPNYDCELSNTLYTHKWTTGLWSDCSISCKDNNSDDPGTQSRDVNCTFQNGTIVESSNCDIDDKPQVSRDCNDYVCDFCAEQSDGLNPCQPNGECLESSGTCSCDNGYSGTYCDTVPGLFWQGITKRVYDNGTMTISLRADPCNRLNTSYDSVGNTLTKPLSGISSINSLYIGDTVSVRWNSSGDLDQLAVGLESLDEDSTFVWPFYVGDSLASDNQDCDSEYIDSGNGTVLNDDYDECFIDETCNDFSFDITTDISPGSYRLVVRFNDEFVIYSENINISCSDLYCNGTGHGICSDPLGTCNCDTDWYGSACSEYNCSDWEFRSKGGDAYSDSEYYNKCFDGDSCDASSSITNVADLCMCGDHYAGDYCEIPIDGCGSLSETDCAIEASDTGICFWDGSECLYDKCNDYTESECGSTPTTSDDDNILDINSTETPTSAPTDPIYSETWECEWDTDLTTCIRIVCADLVDCENGAVRRQLQDYVSICDSWYCDCGTVSDTDAFWKSSETNEFTCSNCSLNCQHDSYTTNCTTCLGCDNELYEGDECNQLFWVGSFKVNIDWDVAYGSSVVEFEDLVSQDLAYLLNVEYSDIKIWQVKPDGDSSIVYFKYIFDTDDEDEAQTLGGDVMVALRTSIGEDGSEAYRGFIMSETDTSYTFEWCIPTKEECDPDAQFDFMFWFLACLIGSFVLEILVVIAYRLITMRRRQKRYEEKVREVRQAQIRLMDHHQKARRVGMRDVSKHRAHKIHSEKHKIHKQEVKDARRRSKVEADEARKARLSMQEQQHQQNPSAVEFQAAGSGGFDRDRIPSQSQPSRHHHSPAPAEGGQGGQGGGAVGQAEGGGGAFNPDVLPPGWKKYFNDDNIPYFYNMATGETTWRHPQDPQF